jgi:hypothetical protein
MLPGLANGLIEKIIHKNGKQLVFLWGSSYTSYALFAGKTRREFVDFLRNFPAPNWRILYAENLLNLDSIYV